MKRYLTLALVISAFTFTLGVPQDLMAMDDTPSMRCEGGIVEVGDSEYSVKEKCGEPDQVLTPDPEGRIQWIYNLGLTYYVSIVDEKVERLQVSE